MLGESWSITLSILFSSVGLIYFMAFYLLKISSFSIQDFLTNSKYSNLMFEDYSELNAPFIRNHEDRNESEKKAFFQMVFEQVETFISKYFQYQTIFMFVCSILFFFFVKFLLDETIHTFYTTITYIFGVLICMFFHYIARKINQKSNGLMIFRSSLGIESALSYSFNAGISLIIGFISFINIFLIITTAAYRSTFVNDHKPKEYEEMFTFMLSGFTIGSFFYRISGTFFQTSMNASADLIAKFDESIPTDSIFNPCSVPNQIAHSYRNFLSSFSDTSTILLFVFTILSILTCQSEQFSAEKSSFFFIHLVLSWAIIISLFSMLFGIVFKFFSKNDLSNYTSNVCKFQIGLSHFFMIFILIFLTMGMYENDFSFFMAGDKPIEGTLVNLQKKLISNGKKLKKFILNFKGWIVFCLFLGYISEVILLINSEYICSHFSYPVRSIVKFCENGPVLNLFMVNIVTLLNFFVPIFLFFVCFSVSYGVLGYFGIIITALGLISNIIPIFALNFVAASSENSLRIGKLCQIFYHENETKNILYNMLWCSQNQQIQIRICNFGVFLLSIIASLGVIISRANSIDIINLKTLQIGGLILGTASPHLLLGIIFSFIQQILARNFGIAKQQFSYFPGLKNEKEVPDFWTIYMDLEFYTLCFTFILFLLNLLFVYFFGLFFGNEGIFGYLLGFLLSGSYLIYHAFISGSALNAAKSSSDNNQTVEKDGSIAASVSIGETYSYLTKETAPCLMVVMIFNSILCILSTEIFKNTGWISGGAGLN